MNKTDQVFIVVQAFTHALQDAINGAAIVGYTIIVSHVVNTTGEHVVILKKDPYGKR